ncbi:hypothetical protein UFOVP1601_40 [uncultured Caudovirales phage]|uniref:Uncharacterized protein n=1 Tax=uncultured Caudovirales phage TaxID=2100421 RepID=A0A6J5SWH8_9CAUD|nr:hypothetical protein UFOVP1154_50 [uncultured Caudovirales phage]CAB4200514.1 hypothetical protein UFOVP1341_43 [uncultured Caudovirales phage]CAB4218797.1 hypothetical protein UFOVP1601_40 [uncultured Caudovirales phage]
MSRRQRTFIGPQGMGGMVSLWGASSLIKSIQYGITVANTAATATATIVSVVPENTILFFLGCQSNAATAAGHWAGSCVLTNATTVTTTYQAATDSRILAFCAVEYYPGVIRSRQSFSISWSGATSSTATITEVNIAKTMLAFGGMQMYQGDQNEPGRITLTNATTVTATRGGATGWSTVMPGQAVEFF